MLKPYFDQAKALRVLLIGDPIYDVYEYVDVLGKASKENVLATRWNGRIDTYYGGAWAAEAILQNFCNEVTYYSGFNITTKRRFVDTVYLRKLFEVHTHETIQVSISTTMLPKNIDEFDLVIVTDFGHGCVTPQLIKMVSTQAKFLAVNAQTNAANYGYNLITKYPRADYIVIDEPEARLAVQDQEGDITDVLDKLASFGYPRFIVTHGRHGSYGYDHGHHHFAPALTQTVVDTLGAGDAVFCVTAPLACVGMPMASLVKIGNAAGAAKVGIRGHERAITLDDIAGLHPWT